MLQPSMRTIRAGRTRNGSHNCHWDCLPMPQLPHASTSSPLVQLRLPATSQTPATHVAFWAPIAITLPGQVQAALQTPPLGVVAPQAQAAPLVRVVGGLPEHAVAAQHSTTSSGAGVQWGGAAVDGRRHSDRQHTHQLEPAACRPTSAQQRAPAHTAEPERDGCVVTRHERQHPRGRPHTRWWRATYIAVHRRHCGCAVGGLSGASRRCGLLSQVRKTPLFWASVLKRVKLHRTRFGNIDG